MTLTTTKKTRTRPDSNLRSLLQTLAAVPEKLFSGAFRQQYAALCFRFFPGKAGIAILVATSRDSGRWIITKGWPMNGKKPFEAAKIEVMQEAGVRGKVRKNPIGCYMYLKAVDDGFEPCVVDVFQIELSELTRKFKEKGERCLAWVSPDEAARRVYEVELSHSCCRSPHADYFALGSVGTYISNRIVAARAIMA